MQDSKKTSRRRRKRQLTEAEEKAYRELARAAGKLQRAQAAAEAIGAANRGKAVPA